MWKEFSPKFALRVELFLDHRLCWLWGGYGIRVAMHNLPPDFTKATDSRSPAFVARYGDVAVELDALPRNVLRERLTDEVERQMDPEALERTRAEERAAIRNV